MPPMNDLGSLLEQEREHLVGVLRDLVRTSRDGHEAVQRYVAQRLTLAGATVDTVAYNPSTIQVDYEIGPRSALTAATYVVGTFGDATKGVLFWAHSDSEPVDSSDWTRPPFDAELSAERMYGWGIGDDLVGVAMMLAAADLHARHGILGDVGVAFASVPSKHRAQAIVHALNRGYGGRATVYLHPAESGSGLGEIKAVASGLLRFNVTVPGRPPKTTEPGHTVFWHTAVDPVALGAELVLALRALNEERGQRVHFAPVHEAIGRSTNLHVGSFQAGKPERPSKIPSSATLHASLTFPPTERLAEVKAEVERALAAFAAQHPYLASHPLTVDWNVGIQGAYVPDNAPILAQTRAAIEAVTGKTPFVNVLHAASDIRNPILHSGIPTVGIGPLVGDLTVSGGRDEWADINDYLRAVEVVVRIARGFGTN